MENGSNWIQSSVGKDELSRNYDGFQVVINDELIYNDN